METKIERSSVRTYLPWLVAAGALVIYLVTLNHSLSVMSVLGLARVAGWDWRPTNTGPLFHLLSLPIRALPQGVQLYAANAFSVLCAVLTLVLLARSVILLPHDRSREARHLQTNEHGLLDIKAAFIPPLLAVLVCGLQQSFWELATVAGSDMLDLLLIAYVIRCLLEYRVDARESWLGKMAFVYGLGVANNWGMIGAFPAFFIALVWTMGLRFFQYRALVRMIGWGLAGLSLYLLLPLLQILTDPVNANFLEALRANLGSQKHSLSYFRPYLVLVLGLTSLLPLLIISIRWPSSLGDISAASFAATNLLMYVIHGAFLAVCLYTAFDPPFSPRRLGAMIGTPLLTYYYIGALCIGYFAGYFLLLFGKFEGKAWERPTAVRELVNRAVVVVVWLLAIGVPAGLVYQNFPRIQARNSQELERYARRLAESLPAKPAIVISDDPIRLYALRAVLGSRAKDYVMLDSGSMPQRPYHRYLKAHYGTRLPEAPVPVAELDIFPPQALTEFLQQVLSRTEVLYLHPSFGYFFETFQQVPRGLVYELKLAPTNTTEIPLLTPDRIREQTAFWQKLDTEDLAAIKARVAKLTKREQDSFYNLLWAASYYSRAANDWGVQLQMNGQTANALRSYQMALDLNPENPCAFINREWITNYTATGKLLDRFSDEAMRRLNPFAGNWDLLLTLNGPVDEPAFRLELAQVFARNGLSRQAALQVVRVLAANPKDLRAYLILGNVYIQGGMPDRALALLDKIRRDLSIERAESGVQLDLIQMEAWAFFAKGAMPKAETILREAQNRYPDLEGAFFALAQLYLIQAEQGRAQGKTLEYRQGMTNALAVFEKQIRLQTKNVPALVNCGGISSQIEDFPRAIAYLSKALEIDPANEAARLNRAISELKAEKLDDAQRDYQHLLRNNPTSYRAHYGMADIAYRKKDWRSATESYESYLKNAPANTAEYSTVQKRLEEVRKKAR